MDPDAALRTLASRQLGLVTTAQATAAGMTHEMLLGRRASGALLRVHRGVHRLAAAPSSREQTVLAAALAARGVVFRLGAALVHGFDAGAFEPEVAIPVARRARVPGVTVVRTDTLTRTDTQRFHTARVTTPTRTIVDLAGVLTEKRLAVVLDDALARQLTAVPVLERRLAALAPQRRSGRATLLKLLAERRGGGGARFRSGLEIAVLDAIRAAGLPEPSLQHPVRRPDGRRAKIDLAYPAQRLAVEVDSYRHHGQLSDWSSDAARHNDLAVLGWRVLRLPEDLVRERPHEIAPLLAAALGLTR